MVFLQCEIEEQKKIIFNNQKRKSSTEVADRSRSLSLSLFLFLPLSPSQRCTIVLLLCTCFIRVIACQPGLYWTEDFRHLKVAASSLWETRGEQQECTGVIDTLLCMPGTCGFKNIKEMKVQSPRSINKSATETARHATTTHEQSSSVSAWNVGTHCCVSVQH